MPELRDSSILLTGGTGFIGFHLASRLSRLGAQVHAVARSRGENSERLARLDGVRIVQLGEDPAQIRGIVEQVRPVAVFHLASKFLVEHRPDDIRVLVDSNVRLGTELTQACAEIGVAALVNTGTSWQNFASASFKPVNLYAATKQAFEDVLSYYADANKLPTATLRLFDTYGPGDDRPKILSLIARAARDRQTLDLSPGEQRLDFVYIDDVVEAYVLAAESLFKNGAGRHAIYGVGTKSHVTLRELVKAYEAATGLAVMANWGARQYRAREVMVPWTGFTTVPGWTTKVGLDEGLRRTFANSIVR